MHYSHQSQEWLIFLLELTIKIARHKGNRKNKGTLQNIALALNTFPQAEFLLYCWWVRSTKPSFLSETIILRYFPEIFSWIKSLKCRKMHKFNFCIFLMLLIFSIWRKLRGKTKITENFPGTVIFGEFYRFILRIRNCLYKTGLEDAAQKGQKSFSGSWKMARRQRVYVLKKLHDLSTILVIYWVS